MKKVKKVWIVWEITQNEYETEEAVELVYQVCATEELAKRVKKEAEKFAKENDQDYQYIIGGWEVLEENCQQKMAKKQNPCEEYDHDYQSVKGWANRYELGGLGETLEKQVVCSKCGQRAREVWIFSCYIEEDEKL